VYARGWISPGSIWGCVIHGWYEVIAVHQYGARSWITHTPRTCNENPPPVYHRIDRLAGPSIQIHYTIFIGEEHGRMWQSHRDIRHPLRIPIPDLIRQGVAKLARVRCSPGWHTPCDHTESAPYLIAYITRNHTPHDGQCICIGDRHRLTEIKTNNHAAIWGHVRQ
jgi:hypothetical protein